MKVRRDERKFREIHIDIQSWEEADTLLNTLEMWLESFSHKTTNEKRRMIIKLSEELREKAQVN
jgi:hypothetical protein